jgi:hypothetical protein
MFQIPCKGYFGHVSLKSLLNTMYEFVTFNINPGEYAFPVNLSPYREWVLSCLLSREALNAKSIYIHMATFFQAKTVNFQPSKELAISSKSL